MARNVTSKANNTDTDRTPAKHYMNVYKDGVQIGYMVLDEVPAIVAKAQEDSEFLNRLIKHESVTAVYREAGVSKKAELDLDSI